MDQINKNQEKLTKDRRQEQLAQHKKILDVFAEEEYLCNDFPFLTHTDPVKSFEAIEGNH